jgi:hypothetical protein
MSIFYILSQYTYGFSNVGVIILILYTIYSLIKSNYIFINKPFVLFVSYITLLQLMNMFFRNHLSSSDINNLINPILLTICLFIVSNNLNINLFYKSYLLVGIIAMLILFYQWVGLFFFQVLPSPIKILPVSLDSTYYSWIGEYYRPSSLFTEPQAYASFMIPLLYLTIKMNKVIISFLIIVSILFSGSSTGIFLIGLISLHQILTSSNKKIKYFLLSLSIIITIIIFSTQDIFESQLNKIFSIDLTEDVRLVKGFQIYSSFNISNSIFGIGDGPNVFSEYNREHAGVLMNKLFDLGSYTTTVAGILISYGIIAGLIFFWVIYRFYKYESKNSRLFLFLIFVASFGQTLLFNGFFMLYYMIYFALNKDEYSNNFVKLKYG